MLLTEHAVENYDDEDSHEGHNHRSLEEDHDDHEDHVDVDAPVAWRFGASILGGFLLPYVSSFCFPHETSDNHAIDKAERAGLKSKEQSANNVEGGELATKDRNEESSDDDFDDSLQGFPSINYSLAASILLGDFFHNFTDGVFVGTAFLLCDGQLAIAIAVATVYHELAQEIADYLLLTKYCNISACTALCLNFVGGLSVLAGALLVMAIEVSSNITGNILAVGGGVYMYIAGVECLPRVKEAHESLGDKLISLVSFVFGVIPIGLVLLNHGHCDA